MVRCRPLVAGPAWSLKGPRPTAACAPLKENRARGHTPPVVTAGNPPSRTRCGAWSTLHLPKTSFSRLYVPLGTRTPFEGGGPLGLSAIPRCYADDASVCIGHPTRFVSVSSQAA